MYKSRERLNKIIFMRAFICCFSGYIFCLNWFVVWRDFIWNRKFNIAWTYANLRKYLIVGYISCTLPFYTHLQFNKTKQPYWLNYKKDWTTFMYAFICCCISCIFCHIWFVGQDFSWNCNYNINWTYANLRYHLNVEYIACTIPFYKHLQFNKSKQLHW